MKKSLYSLIAVAFVAIVLVGCSTKKDKFINRNFHAVTTKFNVLHNGKEALADGREQLVASYKDNYWEVLPVERLELQESIILPGQAKNPNFERAEEKSVKAIQKHSMDIKNRQRNPQIDEAYFLLGKARYYDQRFLPALEAFNYIIRKYPDSDIIAQARVWREKTNIRLENEEVAIENLQNLLRYEEDIKDQDYADARAIMAQAYLNLKNKDTAINHLKVAAKMTKSNEERGRYYFIIGQLYNELGHKDTANMAFDKVIDLNRKTSRNYLINAHVEKAKNFEASGISPEEQLETLLDLEKDRENRPYLDKIYREFARFYQKQDSVEAAVHFWNRSLNIKGSTDRFLKALNYEDLAQVQFDSLNYATAGLYIDSTLSNLDQRTKKYRLLKKKRDNLQDVIDYERIVFKNDSILRVANMPEAERMLYFEGLIADLKAAEEAKKLAEEAAKKKDEFQDDEFFNKKKSGGRKASQEFYFYNTVTAAYGKNEFVKIWGDRPLEDNWRVSKNTTSLEADLAEEETKEEKAIDKEEFYKVEYYAERTPTDAVVLDSLVKDRNFALYQLGIIYKEKFKEYDLAIARLQTLLDSDPEQRLILPSKYTLYKIYQVKGSEAALAVKDDIIKNHPDSRYAEILKNPELINDDSDSDSPETRYAQLYRAFEKQEYEKVIVLADEYITKYNGLEIVPKFELLKATAIGRLDGFEAYKNALNQVALTYPNNPEGKEAQTRVASALAGLANKTLKKDSLGLAKLVYPFKKGERLEERAKLKETIERALKELVYRNNSVSVDVYDRDKIFVVVHGFKTPEFAAGFAELLNTNKDYLVDNEYFVALSSNYKVIQVHKNMDELIK
ncbi:tetratricopeptide repeat protein [Sungkyunkwania multivorans]|uniref:Tetratricopeptide repeat protein n=1 Tax=Sungkyunkwania multivorans TaxID=1173618 RepID=A0ABW3CZW2_9FLAO